MKLGRKWKLCCYRFYASLVAASFSLRIFGKAQTMLTLNCLKGYVNLQAID